MKKLIFILIMILSFVSCKKDTQEIFYEISITTTTIKKAINAIETNTPLPVDFTVNSNGEIKNNNTLYNLNEVEIQYVNTLMEKLSTHGVATTYGISRNTHENTQIYIIQYWYKDTEDRTWINVNTKIPTELQDIWNWYLSIQNSI